MNVRLGYFCRVGGKSVPQKDELLAIEMSLEVFEVPDAILGMDRLWWNHPVKPRLFLRKGIRDDGSDEGSVFPPSRGRDDGGLSSWSPRFPDSRMI